MDPREVQQLLDDLEPRIERLKALYQQYFMGIEKIPPAVLRKDVERTFWRLRRQRLQTTRLRFKFQQLVQRYNSYQQYWARIMREIERGTFKRDVVRAAKRFGEDPAEVGRAARAALESELLGDEAPTAWEIDAEEAAGDEAFGASMPWASPAEDEAPTPPARKAPAARVWNLSDDDVLPNLEAMAPAARPTEDGRVPPAPSAPGRARPGALVGRPIATRAPAAELPTAHAAPSGPPAPPGASPNRTVSEASAPPPRGAPHPPAAGGAPVRPPLPRRPPPAPPQPPARSLPGPAPHGGAPRVPNGPPPAPPPPPRRAPAAAPAPAASGDRTRQLYDEYMRARRAAGEAVDNLSYDTLKRSLQQQTERLRRKHGDRDVDYEVVTKDGRALIRPVVK